MQTAVHPPPPVRRPRSGRVGAAAAWRIAAGLVLVVGLVALGLVYQRLDAASDRAPQLYDAHAAVVRAEEAAVRVLRDRSDPAAFGFAEGSPARRAYRAAMLGAIDSLGARLAAVERQRITLERDATLAHVAQQRARLLGAGVLLAAVVAFLAWQPLRREPTRDG